MLHYTLTAGVESRGEEADTVQQQSKSEKPSSSKSKEQEVYEQYRRATQHQQQQHVWQTTSANALPR